VSEPAVSRSGGRDSKASELPALSFNDESLPHEMIAGNRTFLIACLNLFRASELWGARMGTFLAETLPDAEMRGRALLHTAEEIEHTRMFDHRIRELDGVSDPVPRGAIYLVCCAEAGVIPSVDRLEGPPIPLSREESIRLFAGLHVIEKRGVYVLGRFAQTLPPGDGTRETFEAVVNEEADHADNNLHALARIVGPGGGPQLGDAVARAVDAEKGAWAVFLERARGYGLDMVRAASSRAREEVIEALNALCARFRADGGAGVRATVAFDLTDVPGLIRLTIADGFARIAEREEFPTSATLRMESRAALDMAYGRATGRDLLLAGRLKIGGSVGLAMRLDRFFGTPNHGDHDGSR